MGNVGLQNSPRRTKDGLEVVMPAEKPCAHAFVLKIAGENLIAPTLNKERQ
jgi:hypothetical protein